MPPITIYIYLGSCTTRLLIACSTPMWHALCALLMFWRIPICRQCRWPHSHSSHLKRCYSSSSWMSWVHCKGWIASGGTHTIRITSYTSFSLWCPLLFWFQNISTLSQFFYSTLRWLVCLTNCLSNKLDIDFWWLFCLRRGNQCLFVIFHPNFLLQTSPMLHKNFCLGKCNICLITHQYVILV